MKEITVEILIIAAAILFGIGALNPYWMPMGIQMTFLAVMVVGFGVFASFLWREDGTDEREVYLRSLSDRIAFLAGSGVLLVAIIVDSAVHHHLNEWAIGAFIVMITAKAGSSLYHRRQS